MWNYLWFIVLIKVTTSDKRNTPDMPNLAGERPDRVHRSRELCALYGEGNWQLIPSYVTAYVVKYLAQFLWTCRQNRCLDWFPRLRAISLKVSSKRGYWVNTIDSCSSLANFIFRFSNIKKKLLEKVEDADGEQNELKTLQGQVVALLLSQLIRDQNFEPKSFNI